MPKTDRNETVKELAASDEEQTRRKMDQMVYSKRPNNNQNLLLRTPKTFMNMEKSERRHSELDRLHNKRS